MTLGGKIAEARKRASMTLEDLGRAVGMSRSNICVIENDGLKDGPGRETLIRIAKAVGDTSILSAYCDACPIRGEIFIKKFPELNNIQTDPTAIAVKVRKELKEAIEALDPLIDQMDKKDFASCPDFQQVQEQTLIQIIGTSRALEILKEQYMIQHILSPEQLRSIIQRQQEICEAHGHHKPAQTAAP